MSSVVNQEAFLRNQREFPEQADVLSIELEKAYIDIANMVNVRSIGIYAGNRPAITGNSYFINKNFRQHSQRQTYVFTSTTAIPHGIKKQNIDYMGAMYGQFTDGTNWYGLFPGSTTAITGQISFYIDSTNINFILGAGAPTLTKGMIILEWVGAP